MSSNRSQSVRCADEKGEMFLEQGGHEAIYLVQVSSSHVAPLFNVQCFYFSCCVLSQKQQKECWSLGTPLTKRECLSVVSSESSVALKVQWSSGKILALGSRMQGIPGSTPGWTLFSSSESTLGSCHSYISIT